METRATTKDASRTEPMLFSTPLDVGSNDECRFEVLASAISDSAAAPHHVLRQFESGVLDVDGLALMLHAYGLDDHCYVANGYSDCEILVSAARARRLSRYIIIAKDYEPHFLVLAAISSRLLIVDSTPYDPDRTARKWGRLFGCKAFVNRDFMQHDDFSCKLFSFTAARRLQDLADRELDAFLDANEQSGDTVVVPLINFPAVLVKDVQSVTFIRAYLAVAETRGDDTAAAKLGEHIEQRAIDGKPQNLSIVRFLEECRARMTAFLAASCVATRNAVCRTRLGLDFCHDAIESPAMAIDVASGGARFRFRGDILSSPEEVYDEGRTTVLMKKPREDVDLAVMPWATVYKPYLLGLFADSTTATWADGLDVASNGDAVVVNASVPQLVAFARRVRRQIETDISACLDAGMSQILSTYSVSRYLEASLPGQWQ